MGGGQSLPHKNVYCTYITFCKYYYYPRPTGQKRQGEKKTVMEVVVIEAEGCMCWGII